MKIPRKLLVGGIAAMASLLLANQTATADVPTPMPAAETFTFAEGVYFGGPKPPTEETIGDTHMRRLAYFADPARMPESLDAGVKAMVDQVQPDANGVCAVGGNSFGGMVAYATAAEKVRTCKQVILVQKATPTGDASMAGALFDSEFVKFPRQTLPSDDVTVYRVLLESDGYANWQKPLQGDAVEVAKSLVLNGTGILTAHYEYGKDQVSGQTYSNFTGQYAQYTVDGEHYYVGLTKNQVGVAAEATIRMALPGFSLGEAGYNTVEQFFPRTLPGNPAQYKIVDELPPVFGAEEQNQEPAQPTSSASSSVPLPERVDAAASVSNETIPAPTGPVDLWNQGVQLIQGIAGLSNQPAPIQ